MSATLTMDERRRAMRALGIPPAKIDAVLLGPQTDVPLLTASPDALTFPIRFTLPWSALISDDRKYGAALMRCKGTPYPRLVLTPPYREAKRKAHRIALDAMVGHRPLTEPLALIASVWLPDNRPGHDVTNFAKCAHDALEKAVYANDSWLWDARWIRSGVDVDRPRAEIEIRGL